MKSIKANSDSIVIPSKERPNYNSSSFKKRIKKAKKEAERIKDLSEVDGSKLHLRFEV